MSESHKNSIINYLKFYPYSMGHLNDKQQNIVIELLKQKMSIIDIPEKDKAIIMFLYRNQTNNVIKNLNIKNENVCKNFNELNNFSQKTQKDMIKVLSEIPNNIILDFVNSYKILDSDKTNLEYLNKKNESICKNSKSIFALFQNQNDNIETHMKLDSMKRMISFNKNTIHPQINVSNILNVENQMTDIYDNQLDLRKNMFDNYNSFKMCKYDSTILQSRNLNVNINNSSNNNYDNENLKQNVSPSSSCNKNWNWEKFMNKYVKKE